MKWMRVLIVGGMIAALAAAGFLTLRGLGVLEESDLGRPRMVPQGDQEIAYIAPSTATDGWERLVAAIKLLKKEWKQIHNTPLDVEIDDTRAFLQLSADVPEVGLGFGDDSGGKLWIRWYKLSNVNDSRAWVRRLARRGPPPLAIVGGDTTDRALEMARVLEADKGLWTGPPPLFLITTATADRYLPTDAASANLSHDRWPKLLDAYPTRSFRFAFTNARMVEAVLEFIQQNSGVWVSQPPDLATQVGIWGLADLGSVLARTGSTLPTQPHVVYSLAWSDDGYSKDLGEIFFRLSADQFREAFGDNGVANVIDNYVLYSTGDFYQPNRREEIAVGLFLADDRVIGQPKRLLVLPTGTQRARRFLRTLCRRAPSETGKMVVATGDSISFNSVYRDRDIAWNIQDMPVPLVFFSHRNPIDRGAGFGKVERKGEPPSATGTQDLLLNRDILEAILHAGFDKGVVVADAAELRKRLLQTIWHQGRVRSRLAHPAAQNAFPFFDSEGNRVSGTGEHVVWLQPRRDGLRILPEATLSVWHVDSSNPRMRWDLADDPLHVRYDRLQEGFFAGNCAMIPPWVRAVLPPLLIALLIAFLVREPIRWWLRGEEIYDQENMREWVREARAPSSLPDLTRRYLKLAEQRRALRREADKKDETRSHFLLGELRSVEQRLEDQREEILEHLQTLGNAPTKMYSGQLPLFPVVYRLALQFDEEWDLRPIVWDSQLPRQTQQYRDLSEPLAAGSRIEVQYRLHAYQQRHFQERQEATRRLLVGGVGLMSTLAMVLWFVLVRRREQARDHDRLVVEQQANAAERRRLEEEIRRQDAERKHQEAERINLELKSQLFANIGIMAGSYAHNIKNLLVRPNDLLRRCLEDGLGVEERGRMLQEVKQTLGTVTERLQQILQTVRRDPTKSEAEQIDLNALVADLHRTWKDLSQDKWKMTLRLELPAEGVSIPIHGDASNLQQAFENLLFNARDATFEMRTRLRDQARNSGSGPSDPVRRDAMIAAAAWKGDAVLRTIKEGEFGILEVQDNGIGMAEEVRQRCLETHFSTKRDNALFTGMTAGMGLGLSFVQAILEHHGAKVEIESRPLHGACFRIRFPLAKK